jgi:hypothetical protein
MSVVGSNVVRVQESAWSSAAGKPVDECLNNAARNWKFDTTFGPPKQLITQVTFKPAPVPNPDSLAAKKADSAAAKKKP